MLGALPARSHDLAAMPASQRRPDPSRYQDTRLKALELFARRGFSRVSMRDLAEHLGIAAGSLYNHIESKEALLFELIEELYEELLHGAQQVSRQAATAPARLRALVEAHLQLHGRMAAHFRLAEYENHCLNDEQRARIDELRAGYQRLLIAAVEQCNGRSLGDGECAALGGIIALLNQLPAWIDAPQLSVQARQALLQDMAQGALRGALGTWRD